MTVPGGVPNLPQGALTIDTLASKTQDMSSAAMKSRAVERFPSIMDNSTGLSAASDLTPFGILTGIFAAVQSLVANADPADITGPEDLPELVVEWIEGLPFVGTFVDLFDAVLGTYDGDDETLLGIQTVFKQVSDSFAAADQFIQDTIDQVESAIAGSSVGTYLTDMFTSVEDWWNDTQTTAGQASDALGNTTDIVSSIVNWLSGQTGTWAIGDEAQPLADTAANLASVQAAVAALKQQADQGGINGQSVVIDFSTYPNTTQLATNFTTTYTGSGTNPLGITSGRAVEGSGNNTARSAQSNYNVFVTNTDYQAIGGVWSGKPVTDGFGNYGMYELEGRKNSAGTTRVAAQFKANSVELCCFNTGTKTSFAILGNGGSGFFNFKTGAVYFLLCGTTGGLRIFVVTENGVPILTYTDTSTSQVGSSFRATGLGASWPTNTGNINPGALLYWAAQDNSPAPTLGCSARMHRTLTATMTQPSGVNALVASFFNTITYNTADITPSASAATFTITKTRTYIIVAHFDVNTLIANRMQPVLYLNGSPGSYGGPDQMRGRTSFGTDVAPRGLGGVWVQYLTAGTVVGVGFDNDGAASAALIGESTGAQSYFSITGLPNTQ